MNRNFPYTLVLGLMTIIATSTTYAQDTCQTIIPTVSSYSPTIWDTCIDACKGAEVSVTGSATFSVSAAGANYYWNFGDGADSVAGVTATHIYTQGGIYTIVLTVADANGCTGVTTIYAKVPNDPDFSGTSVSIDTVCAGEPYTLTGMAKAVKANKICSTPIADTTFLPDGNGVSYETSIPVTCFNPGQTVTSGSDIASVCVNIEHSYIGDLIAHIECPNGQSALLFDGNDYTPLNTYLGEPNDELCTTTGNMVPGVGYTYCFDPAAVLGPIVDEESNIVANVGCPVFNSVAPDTYQPQGSFNNLIGCPLNGNWTITITDDQGQDNGYIFYWDIDFNPDLETSDSFKPVIVDQYWLNDPTMTSNNGSTAVAVSEDGGTKCYIYEATDNYNCTYDTTVCLFIKDRPLQEFKGEICPGETFMGHGAPGIYSDTLTAASGCDSIRTITVVANPFPNVAVNANTLSLCEGDTAVLRTDSTRNATYQWLLNGSPIQDKTASQLLVYEPGAYSLAGTSDKGCSDTSRQYDVTVNPPASAEIFGLSRSADDLCLNDTITISARTYEGYQYHWLPEKYFRSNSGYFYPSATITVSDEKTPIQLMVMNAFGCKAYDSMIIFAHPCCDVYIPTAFTPNGDGNNDYFFPLLRPYQQIVSFKIFDRYGKMVYDNEDPQKGWNGNYPNGDKAATDTYMYMIKYTCTDGQVYSEKNDVTLIR